MDGQDVPLRSTRPTLADVAVRAGVSRTTVSNAYNRPDQLSVSQRRHVLLVAAELGYAGPDPMARSLRTRTADAIGLVFSARLSQAFTDPAAVEFLGGVAEACEQRDRSLLLIATGPSGALTLPNTGMVERAAVDGFVVYSLPEGDPHVDAVFSRPQAAVIVDSPDAVPGVDFVGIDDRAGFRAVSEHILALGHERIAVIALGREEVGSGGGEPGWHGVDDGRNAVYINRRLGLFDAIRAHGTAVDVSMYAGPGNSNAVGRSVTCKLLDGPNPPTAIMCMSDALAFGVLAELAQRGVPVPAQISVSGFDDVPDAALRGLTTVTQPTREKGRLAAMMLLDDIAADPEQTSVPPRVARRTILPTVLAVRATTGPAPAGPAPTAQAR